MQNTIELIKWIQSHHPENIQILGEDTTTPFHELSKINQLYELLKEGKVNTDEEAAIALGYAGKHIGNYRRDKAALKQKVLPLFYFWDEEGTDQYENEWQLCLKKWSQIELLSIQGFDSIAKDIALEMLPVLKEYRFVDTLLKVARFLRGYYGQRNCLDEFNEYRELYLETIAEKELKDLLGAQRVIISIKYGDKKYSNKKLSQEIRAFIKKVESNFETSTNIYILMEIYRLKTIMHAVVHDYKQVNAMSYEAICFFREKKNVPNVMLANFYNLNLISSIHQKEYLRATEALDALNKLSKKETNNWFNQQGLAFRLALLLENYEKAIFIRNNVLSAKKFEFTKKFIKEKWRIYDAYLYYIQNSLTTLGNVSSKDNFRIGKFLNTVPIYSKDKIGLNISILIIHYLLLLRQKKYDKIIDKAEGLAKYLSRYISEKSNPRTYYFIKVLLNIERRDFKRQKLEVEIGELILKLKHTPQALTNESHQIEIVPYEKILDFLIPDLD